MNDQVILDNYLMLLKSSVEVYVHGTLESSNKKSRELLRYGLDETLTHQALTYDLMSNLNYYNVDNVKESDVKKVLNSLN